MGALDELPEVLWARAGLAAGSKAIAAAKMSQMGSKRIFFVIILGIPCLFGPAGERKMSTLYGEKKRLRKPLAAALPVL
jgi:hypothetical protein